MSDYELKSCDLAPVRCFKQCIPECIQYSHCAFTQDEYCEKHDMNLLLKSCSSESNFCLTNCLEFGHCFLCTNTCDFGGDAECDDGGIGSEFASCPIGSDCEDCGSRGGTLSLSPRSSTSHTGNQSNAPRPTPLPPSRAPYSSLPLHPIRLHPPPFPMTTYLPPPSQPLRPSPSMSLPMGPDTVPLVVPTTTSSSYLGLWIVFFLIVTGCGFGVMFFRKNPHVVRLISMSRRMFRITTFTTGNARTQLNGLPTSTQFRAPMLSTSIGTSVASNA